MNGRKWPASVRHASHLQGHLRSPAHVQPGEVMVGAILFVLLIEHEVVVLSRPGSSKQAYCSDVESHRMFLTHTRDESRAATRSSSSLQNLPPQFFSKELAQHTSSLSRSCGIRAFGHKRYLVALHQTYYHARCGLCPLLFAVALHGTNPTPSSPFSKARRST